MAFKSLLATGAVFSAYLGQVAESSGAMAVFDATNHGIEGTVNVTDGRIMIMLDISVLAAMDYEGIPGGEACFTSGLKFHIHEMWGWDNDTDRIGSTPCGSGKTGGHWDPWLACGSATGNDYCTAQGGCVSGSSALMGSTGYDCDETNFDVNAYSCEVGDWNGKYGLAMNDNGTIYLTGESAYEVDGSDVVDFSVVFHCGDGGARAFCAPFTAFDDDTARPTQEDDFDAEYMMATFSGNNISAGLVLHPNGSTGFAIDFDNTDLGLDDACTELMVRIYNDWDDDLGASSTSECDDAVGMFYDPTVTCAYGTDSEFCTMTYLCNETSYEYSCDFDTAADRFLCAPGDITGKFGTITVADSGSATIDEVDDLLIDLNLLSGKSVVLQCSNDYSIVACAGLYEYTGGDDDDDDDDDDDTTGMPATTLDSNSTGGGAQDDGANMLNSSMVFGIIVCLVNYMFN